MRRLPLMHSLRAAALAACLAVPIIALTASAQALASPIRDDLMRQGFSGTILVSRAGRTVVHESFGIAERSFGARATNDTHYRVASITKLFTSVLVLQLQDAGRLDVQRTVRSYLPDYRGAGGDRVTLHQLLNHTSGITNFDQIKSYEDAVQNGMPSYQLPRTPRQLLDLYASGPLVSEPGSKFDYNNADYIILGMIIERVTGHSYAEVLRSQILEPLALRETGVADQSVVLPRLAQTYFRPDTSTPLTNDLPAYFQNWYAAGAMYSTAADIERFAAALFGGRVLKPASLKLLLTPALDDYAYGLWVDSSTVAGRRRPFAHRPGSIMGANTVLVRYLDDDLTVVILGNTNLVDLDALAFKIGRTILGAP